MIFSLVSEIVEFLPLHLPHPHANYKYSIEPRKQGEVSYSLQWNIEKIQTLKSEKITVCSGFIMNASLFSVHLNSQLYV